MEKHKRILGILYIISAVTSALALMFLNVIFSMIFTFAASKASGEEVAILGLISSLLRWIPTVFILVFAIPSLIAGLGLLSNKSWAMTLALVMGCFKLFSFPIGTGIAIYTIWVYTEDHKTKIHPSNA
nr:hypothetical protein [uncultured bacterium]